MSSSSQIAESWISAFCSLIGHEYFAEVSEEFIEDDFNLTGLQSQVPMYKEALEMILDVEPEDDDDDDLSEEEEDDQSDLGSDASMHENQYTRAAARRHARMQSDISMIESSAEMLYGLIHQRFITSRQGIQQMMEKYEMGHFGSCPRVHCRGAKVLPVGCSDIPGQETVKLFCPACLDVYAPPNSRFQGVDGAFFGTTFGCLFFMTFPDLDVGGGKIVENGGGLSATNSNDSSHLDGKGPTSSLSPSARSQTTQNHADISGQPDIINGVTPQNLAPGLGSGNIYEPKIYGFRVSELAKTGPRMKWLRQKPTHVSELDEVAIWESNRTDEDRIGEDNAPEEEEEEEEEMEEDLDEDVDAQDEEEDESGGVVGEILDEAGKGKKSRHRGVNGDGGGGGASVR